MLRDVATDPANPKKDEKDYYGKLLWSYRTVLRFYAEYDWNLEWWMTHGEEVKTPTDEMEASEIQSLRASPSHGDLLTKLRVAGTGPVGLEAKLKQRDVKLGMPPPANARDDENPYAGKYGFNWEVDFKWDPVGEKEIPAVLKILQKRYWIRKRIANACLAQDVKVQRLVDVYFFRPLHKNLSGGNYPWDTRASSETAPDSLPYAGSPIRTGTDRGRFDEFDLPGDLGKTITFGVALDLMYPEVNKFVRKLLDRDLAPRLLLSTVGMRMMVLEQNPATLTYTYDWKERDDGQNKKRQEDAEKKFLEENKAHLQLRPVRLLLTCQVVDFDSAKLPDSGKALLPNWAKPPKDESEPKP